ncbi:MAG: sugar phosphate nucleotidyltransferase [Lachnospiraceae bacterium]|nr:sugar phosphate nucleotidyltransferase [Lachnospiraceae bacterium]
MKLENMLVDENCTIKDAVERLEKYRCKNVYVVKNMQLKAAISDGDARRFLLKKGNINDNVKNIANYSPISFYENQLNDAKELFLKSELQSIPILNLNDEIVLILFRNQRLYKSNKRLNLPVVIMAGGKGTRLYPYTKILPKALIPIGDIPISEHIMNRLFAYGCKDFYIIVNHKKNMIKSYFENVEKDYELSCIEEETALGTGGGLFLLKDKIKHDFILSNCDVLIDSDYAKIYGFHKKNKNFITIVAAEKCIKIPYGVLQMDETNEYCGVVEKPEHHYTINTGFYIANAKVIEDIENNVAIGFPDIIENYRKKGYKIGIYVVKEKAFMDMGQLEEMEIMRQNLGIDTRNLMNEGK